MAISYQEQAQLTCPACGAEFEASIWLLLDAAEQPEATEALRRAELNMVVCPHCGNSGPAGAPLLFHDGAARRVIFVAAPGSAEHEIRDQARELHTLLIGSIPEEQRRPYLTDVDIAQDVAGVAHLLRRMDRRRMGGAAGAVAPVDPPAPNVETPRRGISTDDIAPTPSEEAPPLLLAVQDLLAANTTDELDQALAAHPLLLEPATDQILAQLANVAVEQRAYEIAESLQQARQLLAEMSATVETPRQESAPESSLAQLPEAAYQAMLQAGSANELLAVVEAHPLLLHPAADALLGVRVEAAIDEGNERLAHAIEERREALAQLRVARANQSAVEEPAVTLDEAIESLLIAEGEEAIAATIDQYPVLLEDVAGQALWQFASEARASGDEDLAVYAIECREMLRRIRERLKS